MTVGNISFMAKPVNTVVKKAAEKAEALKEQATYLGKEPMGEVANVVKNAKEEEVGALRAAALESYLASRQQVIKPEAPSADEIAEAYRAAHGIKN